MSELNSNTNSNQEALPAISAKPSWKQAIRGNVLAMGLVSLFTDFSSEMMNPLLPIFIAGLVGGVKAAFWVGLMEGVAETTASLLKIFSGRISDSTGKRKALVVLGYGASSRQPADDGAGGPGGGSVRPALQVVVLKFLDRVGKGIRTSPRDALIGDSVPKEYRGLAFSFHRAMDHTGAVLGPLVAIVVLYACWAIASVADAGHPDRRQPASGEHVSRVRDVIALRWLFAIALIPGIAAMAAAVFKAHGRSSRIDGDGGRRLKGWRRLCRASSTPSSASSRCSPWATAPTCSSAAGGDEVPHEPAGAAAAVDSPPRLQDRLQHPRRRAVGQDRPAAGHRRPAGSSTPWCTWAWPSPSTTRSGSSGRCSWSTASTTA